MSGIVEGILSLQGWLALTLVFVLPALEAPAFIGLVLPGELALVLGGVLAHEGRISLAATIAVGVAAAVIGDSTGYWLGRRWRGVLLASPLGRRVKPAHLRRAESIIERRGGPALAVGRLTAGARVLLPGLAGASRLRYRTFLAWNAPAGAAWAVAHVMLGYLTGEGWRRVHHLIGQAGLGLLIALAVIVLAATITLLIRRHRRGTRAAANAASDPDPGAPDPTPEREAEVSSRGAGRCPE